MSRQIQQHCSLHSGSDVLLSSDVSLSSGILPGVWGARDEHHTSDGLGVAAVSARLSLSPAACYEPWDITRRQNSRSPMV